MPMGRGTFRKIRTDFEIAERREEVDQGSDIKAHQVHEDEESDESRKGVPELFLFEAVKNLRKVIVHFVVFPAGQKHISYMNCGKHKQEAYDEVRIVSDRFRILFRKIEEEETEEVHESADKNI